MIATVHCNYEDLPHCDKLNVDNDVHVYSSGGAKDLHRRIGDRLDLCTLHSDGCERRQ